MNDPDVIAAIKMREEAERLAEEARLAAERYVRGRLPADMRIAHVEDDLRLLRARSPSRQAWEEPSAARGRSTSPRQSPPARSSSPQASPASPTPLSGSRRQLSPAQQRALERSQTPGWRSY